MLNVIGAARNITGLIVDGIPEPVPTVEVVLICQKPFYGITGDGKRFGRGDEVVDLRFHGTPKALRNVAMKLIGYADEAEECFGVEPDAEEIPVESGKKPEPVHEGEASQPTAEPVAETSSHIADQTGASAS